MLNNGILVATSQTIYLDFDGANTCYHNRDLDIFIDNITVEDSGLDAERIAMIVDMLNALYGDDIYFTSSVPTEGLYSTIYIGMTSAFDEYGSFLGLAETIDSGNLIPDDNAFVFLNSTASTELVTSVIAHETEHIVKGMEHEGDGVGRYAAPIVVSDGIVSDNVIVSSWNSLVVSSGGTANSAIVNSYASMFVSSGGTANSAIVNNYGSMYVYSGGTANSTTLNGGGSLYVYSGGTALNISWTPCVGHVYVADSAYATFISKYNGCYFGNNGILLSTGISFANKLLGYRYSMYVFCGGTANSATVCSGGYLYVYSGGTANSATVSSGGSLYVHGGGTANSTAVCSGGSLSVSSGGTALNIVENGGYVYVAKSAHVNFVSNVISDKTVSNDMTVHSGTTLNSATVDRGYLEVYSGGTANSTTVNRGYLEVYSGGTALNIVENGGYVYVAESAHVNFVGNFISDIIVSNHQMTVHSGTTVNTATVCNFGKLYVYSGGIVNSTTMDSGGYLYVHSGGTANTATVCSGASLYVSSGGTALNIVENGGYVYVAESAHVNFVGNVISDIIVSNHMTVHSGTTLNSATVDSGGSLEVHSGGMALNIVDNGGYVYIAEGAFVNFASNVISDKIVSNHMTVHSGTTFNSATVSNGGSLEVHSGGTTNSTAVCSGGSMEVHSGGTALNIVENGGYVYVADGAFVNFVSNFISNKTVSNHMTVHSGTTVNSATVDSGGSMEVHSGGTANSAIVSSGGSMEVHSGGTAFNIVENGGYVYVAEGAYVNFVSNDISGKTVNNHTTVHSYTTANSMTVSGEGILDVCSGGMVDSTIVNGENGTYMFRDRNTYGCLNVSSGGTTNYTTVNSGGLNVYSGGTALNIVENGGYVSCTEGAIVTFVSNVINGKTVSNGMTVHSGTTANSTMVNGDFLDVYSGGIANYTTLDEGVVFHHGFPTFTLYGAMSLYSYGIANFTTVNYGKVYVNSEGTVNNTTVNFGWLNVSSGGIANSTTVSSGGTLYIFSGGKHSGTLQIASGAIVYAFSGATIDFTVAAQEEHDIPIIDRYDCITGSPTFTITVNAYKDEGSYALAGYASSFNKTVTVKTTSDAELGTLSVGENLIYNEKIYSLVLNENTLFLNILEADTTPPTITNIAADITTPTQSDVTVSAVFADNRELAQSLYRIGNGDWLDYTGPVTVTENATVYFQAIDTSDNDTTEEYKVSNIDKTAPVITLTGDNENPLQSTTLSASVDDGSQILYSTDNQNWSEYNDALDITSNGTWYFKATDASGNTGYAQRTFGNIDAVAPVITLTGENESPLQSSTLTAITDDGSQILYSTDNQNWSEYTDTLDITENGIWYFKATDAAGNEGTAQITFGNIDTVAPVITLTGDNENPLQSATLTASVDDSSQILYSTDNQNWSEYTGALEITSNGTWYFKATDAAGNTSYAQRTFSNIDKTAPVITLTGDNENPLQSSTLTATTDDGSQILYSNDNQNWSEYTDALAITENGTWYFTATDAAGNTGTAQLTFGNIDTIAPDVPIPTADITTVTNGIVHVSAEFSEDSVLREYRIGDGNWLAYEAPVAMAANGIVEFRGTDAAGNISEITSYEVGNIDSTAPDAPIVMVDNTETTWRPVLVSAAFADDAVIREYRIGEGNWLEYTGEVLVTENCTVQFRGSDDAGNQAITSHDITNIVTSDEYARRDFIGDIGYGTNYQDDLPFDVVIPGLYNIAGDFGKLNGSIALMNGSKKVASGTIKNGVLKFNNGKGALLDCGKNYSLVLKSSDKSKSASGYNFTLMPGTLYTKWDNSDDWDNMKTAGANGKVGNTGLINEDTAIITDDWVGFGDSIDYQAIALDSAASLVFDVTSTDAVKFTVYSLQSKTANNVTTYSLKSLMTSTPKLNKATGKYSDTTKALLLDAGTYYISTQSSNAAKGGSADYKVALNSNSVFFTKGDNSDDAWANAPAFEANDTVTDWVGFGDAIDYRKLTIEDAARLSFSVESTDAAKFTIWTADAKTGKLKSLQATTLTANKAKTEYSATTKELLLAEGTYYISMESTNAAKGGNADYNFAFSQKSEFFTKGDNSDDAWANAPAIAENNVVNDWVGFGDAIDYCTISISDNGGFYSFDLSGVQDNVKMTVYSVEKGKLKQVKSVSATAKKPNISTGTIGLASGKTYVLAVEATGAKTAQNSEYSVAMSEFGVFTGLDNNTWDGAIQLNGDEFTGCLGKGIDSLDCIDLTAWENEGLRIEMEAGSVKASFYDANRKAVKVASVTYANGTQKAKLASITLKDGDKATDSIQIGALDDNIRYLKLEAASTGMVTYHIS